MEVNTIIYLERKKEYKITSELLMHTLYQKMFQFL